MIRRGVARGEAADDRVIFEGQRAAVEDVAALVAEVSGAGWVLPLAMVKPEMVTVAKVSCGSMLKRSWGWASTGRPSVLAAPPLMVRLPAPGPVMVVFCVIFNSPWVRVMTRVPAAGAPAAGASKKMVLLS